MKQTKKLTRAQRITLERCGYTGDTFSTRLVQEDNFSIIIQEKSGQVVRIHKVTGQQEILSY